MKTGKFPQVAVDEIVDFYNVAVRKENQPRLNRLGFGRLIWSDDRTDSTINAQLSYLSAGKRKLTAREMIKIYEVTKYPIDKIYKQ